MNCTYEELKKAMTEGKVVVKFTEGIETTELDPDVNMKAIVVDAQTSREDDGVVKITFDYSMFTEYNKHFAKFNYYDSNGVPCESWFQQRWYEKNEKNDCCYFMEDELYFVIEEVIK